MKTKLTPILAIVLLFSACHKEPTDVNPKTIKPGQLCCEQTIFFGFGDPPDTLKIRNTISADGKIFYKWQRRFENEIDWTNISNANDSLYQPQLHELYFNPDSITSSSYFRVSLTNEHGGDTVSNIVKITVSTIPFVTATLCCDQDLPFGTNPDAISVTITSGEESDYVYCFQKLENSSGWQSVQESSSKSFTPSFASGLEIYRAIVRDVYNHESSTNFVFITCGDYIPIVAGSLCCDQSIDAGQTAANLNLSECTGGFGTLHYQFQKKTNGDWQNCEGANATTASYNPSAIYETTKFRVKITDDNNGEVFSNEVVISIKVHAGELCCDQTIMPYSIPNALSVSNTNGGDGNYHYDFQFQIVGQIAQNEWYSKDVSSSSSNILDLTYYYTYNFHSTKYRCVVYDDAGQSDTTNIVSVTVDWQILDIGILHSDQILNCVKNPNIYLSGATGGSGDYQIDYQKFTGDTWLSSGIASNDLYYPETKFRAVIFDHNSYQRDTSNEITITVLSPPGNFATLQSTTISDPWVTDPYGNEYLTIEAGYVGYTRCYMKLKYLSSGQLQLEPWVQQNSFLEYRPNNHARIDAYSTVECLYDLNTHYSGAIGNNILNVPAIQNGGYIISYQFDESVQRKWIRLRIIEKNSASLKIEYEEF
jgi:hypothetical protein